MQYKVTDLTDCDREPIEIPSAIQPHGTLLVVDLTSDRVVQVGIGTEAVLQPSRPLLNQRLTDVLGVPAAVVGSTAFSGEPIYVSSLIPGLAARDDIDVTAHRSDGLIIIEIERAFTARPSAAHMMGRVRSISAALHAGLDLLDTCRSAARELRELTGFARVMIYRFLEDGSGCVMAEDRDAGLPTFLNHHYPASDIPKQARELYVRNLVRVIPDVNYTPVPLAPHICPATGGPLDMSDCILRSVSPVHIQYLKNMNISASMSVSIVRDDALWGLVACHHTSPKLISYEIREVCKHVAQILSQQIAAREGTEMLQQEHVLTATRLELIAELSHAEGAIDEALQTRTPKLLELLPSDGIAVYAHGAVTTAGYCPNEDQIRELSSWLLRANTPGPYSTDRLSQSFASAEAYRTNASGLLGITISAGEPLVLLWFRAERAEIVNWAGNPHRPVEPGLRPGVLTPRASFELWRETVHGHSRSWTKAEIEAAQRFQNQLVEISQHRRVEQLNSMLQQKIGEADRLIGQKDLLMREMHHRVQNSLQLVSAMLRLQQREFSDPIVQARFEETQRRILAMAAVHRHLWRSTEIGIVHFDIYLHEIRDSLVEAWGRQWGEYVQLHGASVAMPTDKAIILGLIVTELLTNAVKHAYGGEPGPIQILLNEKPERSIQVVIADHGRGIECAEREGGFGSRLTSLLVSQLEGTIEFQDNAPGTKVVLSIPHVPP
jgi:light-regulated signal transduction histidine kinase (bacteriophytochrome)